MDLLLGSYEMHPDALVGDLDRAARRLGARALQLFLVDLEQVQLVPVVPATGQAPLPVDASTAGSAFRSIRPITEPLADGLQLWLPLLDSSERVGVLGLTLAECGPGELRRWNAFASLAGELIVSKARYGDVLDLARRTKPPSLAAELRWAMLPPLNFSSPQVSVAGILEPAYEIAGDTFDYAINGSTAHLAILDAMGHGLEASRMANLAVTSYRHSRRSGIDLREMVTEMDRMVADQFGPARFVTGQLAVLDTDTGLFRMLNLGHPLPALIRDRRVLGLLECEPCLPAGLGSVPTSVGETQLQPGDMVLLHTDGITEARGSSPEEFGEERLIELVDALLARGEHPAEVLRLVIQEVLAFQDHKARDDATLLLVQWRPEQPEDRIEPGGAT